MSFVDLLTGGGFPVALEITPPRRSLPGVLRRRAALLGDAAVAVNVIQRADRQSSLDASIELAAAGIEPVWHLVCRGRTEESVRRDVERARDAGIRQVLCILGDHPVEGSGGIRVRDAISVVRDVMPDALVGATYNQYTADQDAARRNLLGKVAAGAVYVQTQPVFDVAATAAILSPVRAARPELKVIAMVMPLTAPKPAARVEARLGVRLPDELKARIAAGPDEAWRAFAETIRSLAGHPAFDSVAVMTFEPDPATEVAERIVEALRTASDAAGGRR